MDCQTLEQMFSNYNYSSFNECYWHLNGRNTADLDTDRTSLTSGFTYLVFLCFK